MPLAGLCAIAIESGLNGRDRSQTTFTRFVFFDHLPPSVYIFYGIKVYKKSIFLTTYPPPLVNVVCERPLKANVRFLFEFDFFCFSWNSYQSNGKNICFTFFGLKAICDWCNFRIEDKVIYTKYSKHCPYTVAHTFECVCSKINHGLNHGLFISLLKLILCPIHWIVYV